MEQRERFRTREVEFIYKALKEELEHTKEELVSMPMDKVGELRGRARVLKTIVKLLAE
jgi:predicted trehalose synthase